MCTTAALIGSQIAISGTQALLSQQVAEGRRGFGNKLARESGRSAAGAFEISAGTERLRLGQERQATAQILQSTTLAGAEARARARVAAGEAGVGGISVNALLADLDRQEALRKEAARTNLEFVEAQSELNILGLRSTALSRRNAALSATTTAPNPFLAILGVGLGAVGFGSSLGLFSGSGSRRAPRSGAPISSVDANPATTAAAGSIA